MGRPTIAVIGAEKKDFDVTLYEKKDSVGGVWSYSDDIGTTSTLPSTLSNVSKFGDSFTDFPIAEDLPAHLTSSQKLDYLKSYAAHFDLNRDIHLETAVESVKRNADDTKWQLRISSRTGEETKEFDKVVITTGLNIKPTVAHFEGEGKFEGKIIHVQAFKSYSINSTPDHPIIKTRELWFLELETAQRTLQRSWSDMLRNGHAKKVILSHRGGVKLVPRIVSSAPLDLIITRQLNVMKYALDRHFPSLSIKLFDFVFERASKSSFKNQYDPSWRLSPAPSLANHQPVISDNLISSLAAGTIESVHGIKRFLDGKRIELLDGTILEDIDTVVLCTGYEPDFSIVSDFSPLTGKDDEPVPKAGINKTPLARLYQNIFSPKYAKSLAYMNYISLTDGAITVVDVVAMALAQIWKGNHALPSISSMEASIDEHHAWIRNLGKGDNSVYAGIVRPGPWMHFLNKAAGTGVDENLGYGLQGWRFWWRDRRLSALMMRGLMTPFMYRLFEGEGRKKWDGAREAILRSNEHSAAFRNMKDLH